MSRRFNEQYDGQALEKCRALGLDPKPFPMGDGHHTDVAASEDDERVGGALAYFLGGLFIDKEEDPEILLKESYFYKDMTSCDVWTRVARALRVHGLKIDNFK